MCEIRVCPSLHRNDSHASHADRKMHTSATHMRVCFQQQLISIEETSFKTSYLENMLFWGEGNFVRVVLCKEIYLKQ